MRLVIWLLENALWLVDHGSEWLMTAISTLRCTLAAHEYTPVFGKDVCHYCGSVR